MIDERDVWAQIGEVLDPELDQPLDKLGFIEGVAIQGSTVVVDFRLPTYWCAPNFAYMMTADLRERVARVPGVETVTVRLRDHFAEDEITDGVNAGQAFSAVFAGEADGELDELRMTFLRKAFLVRQEQLLRTLLRAGYAPERLARLAAADVRAEDDALLVREEIASSETDQPGWRRIPNAARTLALYRQKRAAAGLDMSSAGPLFTTVEGGALTPEAVPEHLRAARTIRLNGAFNTVLCTALNRITHGVEVDADALCEETVEQRTAG
ncbi:MAG TPA: iron-sulfur cluster assembly protein [Ktedonobacterales bacterium]|nr:iron-sulfur cluster assembly protein [Ktedonobacterales bacterium]